MTEIYKKDSLSLSLDNDRLVLKEGSSQITFDWDGTVNWEDIPGKAGLPESLSLQLLKLHRDICKDIGIWG